MSTSFNPEAKTYTTPSNGLSPTVSKSTSSKIKKAEVQEGSNPTALSILSHTSKAQNASITKHVSDSVKKNPEHTHSSSPTLSTPSQEALDVADKLKADPTKKAIVKKGHLETTDRVSNLFHHIKAIGKGPSAEGAKMLMDNLVQGLIEAKNNKDIHTAVKVWEAKENVVGNEWFGDKLENNEELRNKTQPANSKMNQELFNTLMSKIDTNKSPGEIEQDLVNFIVNIKDENELADVIKIINYLSGPRGSDNVLKLTKENTGITQENLELLKHVSSDLAQLHQAQMSAVGPSDAARETKRTPSEVLVHLMSRLGEEKGKNPQLASLEQEAKQMFSKHEMRLDSVKAFLDKVNNQCKDQNELSHITQLCQTLKKQLPESESKLESTRLHDNIYGRAYDSALIGALVKNPPEGVRTAMTNAGKDLESWFNDIENNHDNGHAYCCNIATKFQDYLKKDDPRFWFPQVPGLQAVRDAPTPEAALTALKAFLKSPKNSGPECLAIPYALVKLSVLVNNSKEELKTAGAKDVDERTAKLSQVVPWMDAANSNYQKVITPQTARETVTNPKAKQKLNTAGAGISIQPINPPW